MSKYKHSKGPWKRNRNTVHADGIRISQSGHVGGQSNTVLESAGEVREANAKLIAAAPDLLESLEKILFMSRSCPGDKWDEFTEAQRIATEAIKLMELK